VNYYEHHLGDYAKDASHLSLVEDGAYRRLLDAYYIREQPLPGDLKLCCKLARANTKPERDAVKYVLGEFFDLRDDGYHQNRADAEIARFQAKSEKAKRSAEARWADRETHSEGNANAYANASPDASPNAMRTHSEGNAPRARPQSPVTRSQEKSKIKNGAAAPVQIPIDPKAALWARWKALPDGGGGAFLAKQVRDFRDEQRVLEAVERTLDHAPADPKSFLIGVLREKREVVHAASEYADGVIL